MTKLYCDNFKRILTTEDDNGNLLIARTRCKRWDCEYCAGINREIWRAKIINHINESDDNWGWFTITAHSKMRGASLSLTNLRGAWDKLIKRMKRHYGNFSYVRVYEPHKDASFHIHAIVSVHFDDIKERENRTTGEIVEYSQWMTDTAKELHLGWYTHANNCPQNAHGGFVASYITKYVTKLDNPHKRALGRIRMIQTSQGWTELKNEQQYEWELAYFLTIQDYTWYQVRGNKIIDINTGEIISKRHFQGTSVYPPEA